MAGTIRGRDISRSHGPRRTARRQQVGLLVALALLAATGCAPSGSQAAATATASRPPTAADSAASFSYGFDLSTQEPDLPRAGNRGRQSKQPSNDAAAVASARRVLASLPGLYVDQSIWGFGIVHSPEPSPGVFAMSEIATRLAMIEAAGDTPVITLVSAPDWMKDHASGHLSLFASPPTPDHYRDFAALAAHVAASFPKVHYFVVWSELRGFWTPATHSWDYRDYTRMYNDVYRAIKQVRPDAKVGGPYADMHAAAHPIRGKVSAVHGGFGYLDQGMLDALTYWLSHKAGADFVAVDGATAIAKSDGAGLTDAVTAAGQYAAVDRWIRARTNLPIWWMESHIQPDTGWTEAQAVAARVATLAEMAASGARVGMQWQPQQQLDWPDEGIWTSTRHPAGGQPTALAKALPRVLPVLAHSPVLTGGEPRGALVASDPAGLVAVNTTDAPLTARVGSQAIPLKPGQVLVH